jgi:chromosome segregation ATPase
VLREPDQAVRRGGVAAVHADIDALKGLHGALARYRHAQRDVAARAQDQVRATRAALEEKASRLRGQLELCQAEYAGCRERAAQADPEDLPVDCSGYARAVAQNTERLEQLQLWQQRVEAEASEFAGIAGRFDVLLADDLPRLEEHLAAIISSLERARHLQAS